MRAAARFFREQGITAIGVCLIHAYANAAHERRAAEIVAQEYPGCTLSLSCDVLPEYREYERAVTTLVDAFIKPHMSRYLARIRDEGALPARAFEGRSGTMWGWKPEKRALEHLFAAGDRFVVVYATSTEMPGTAPHVRHRRFTTWVDEQCPQWRLMSVTPGPNSGSGRADFFVYQRLAGPGR